MFTDMVSAAVSEERPCAYQTSAAYIIFLLKDHKKNNKQSDVQFPILSCKLDVDRANK